MSKRILISEAILSQIDKNLLNGATMASQLRLHGLPVSAPTLTRLVKLHRQSVDDPSLSLALYPSWLVRTGMPYCASPDNAYFVGRFPNGYWEYK